jgi:hypothetical protein
LIITEAFGVGLRVWHIFLVVRFSIPDGEDASANMVAFPRCFSRDVLPAASNAIVPGIIAQVLPLTYVSEGLRAAMIFGQRQQAVMNTALITVLGMAPIIAGSLIIKREED